MPQKTYAGRTIGYLEVLDDIIYKDEEGKTIHQCVCLCKACGKIVVKSRPLISNALQRESAGRKPSCGCLQFSGFAKHNSEVYRDLTGEQFGHLTVIGQGQTITTGKENKKRKTWQCLCDCGRLTYVTTGDLVSGDTRSCGHGQSLIQTQLEDMLADSGIEFSREYYFNDLLSPKGWPLKFDFAIYNKSKLFALVEYHGSQHYTKKNISFGSLQRNLTDQMKREYCAAHSIPLYEIRYDEDIFQRLKDIIQSVHDNTVPSTSCEVKV